MLPRAKDGGNVIRKQLVGLGCCSWVASLELGNELKSGTT